MEHAWNAYCLYTLPIRYFNKQLANANKNSKCHKKRIIELHNTSVDMALPLIRCLPMGGILLINLVFYFFLEHLSGPDA